MYKDLELKINYQKQRIINEFIKNNIYPDNDMIKKKLEDIDFNLAIIRHNNVVSGSNFNTDLFNAECNAIMTDLQFLYSLLYELQEKEFQNLKSFINTKLKEMEDDIESYKNKANLEMNATSLGSTIFYQDKDFNIESNNAIKTVKLDDVNITKGSTISFYMDANDIEANKIRLKLSNNKDVYYLSPYNYNGDVITIDNELQKNTYDFNISDDYVTTDSIIINPKDLKVNKDNKYLIFSNKDKIKIKNDFGETTIIPKEIEEQPSRYSISFFVIGKCSIEFLFNKKPIYTNFNMVNNTVVLDKHINYLFLECDKDFIFNIVSCYGQIYADKEIGFVDKDILYYPPETDCKSFYIEEYVMGDKEVYNATVEIYNDNNNPIDIKDIYIKELLEIGDV